MPFPIVFDLDGTLVDSAPDIHATVNTVLHSHAVAPLSLERVRAFIGGGVEVLWQKIAAERGLDGAATSAMTSSFLTLYEDATELSRLFPGVREALATLAGKGHPLGLCTNKPMAPTLAVLDHFAIGDFFDILIAGDSLPQRKPAPEPLLAALSRLGDGTAARRGIYVGDSEFDTACAAAAGVPIMLYTLGYRLTPVEDLVHHAAFDDFALLPDLIAQATPKTGLA